MWPSFHIFSLTFPCDDIINTWFPKTTNPNNRAALRLDCDVGEGHCGGCLAPLIPGFLFFLSEGLLHISCRNLHYLFPFLKCSARKDLTSSFSSGYKLSREVGGTQSLRFSGCWSAFLTSSLGELTDRLSTSWAGDVLVGSPLNPWQLGQA